MPIDDDPIEIEVVGRPQNPNPTIEVKPINPADPLTSTPLTPNLTADPAADETLKITGNQSTADDDATIKGIKEKLQIDQKYLVRLQKLSQQFNTVKLQTATDSATLTTEIFKDFYTALEKNITSQKKLSPTHQDHYEESVWEQLSNNKQELHNGITITGNPNANLTMNLSDGNQITANFQPKDNQIYFTSTSVDDKSLVILIEAALKAAKKMNSKTFIIYPSQASIEDIGKLCAMASFAGLKPVFKVNPNTADKDTAKQELTGFTKKFEETYKTTDPSKLADFYKADPTFTPKNTTPPPAAPAANTSPEPTKLPNKSPKP